MAPSFPDCPGWRRLCSEYTSGADPPPGGWAEGGPHDRINCLMSKRSTATLRARPVEAVASVTGAVVIHGENIQVPTSGRTHVIDRPFAIREGQVSLWSMHTTCALFINESQKALIEDITTFLEEVVARDHYYRHNDPQHSDCDRANADSHLRALLLGHSLTLQISGGEVVLGQWQRLLMAELDGPRTRTIRLQVIGIK
jgi:secondary thiamine-phosphate synthase enzyme